MTQTNRKLYPVAAGIAAGLLLWALSRHSYDYYTLLRWVVCAVAVYGVVVFSEPKRMTFIVPLGVIALFFNPLIPVHLSRSTWAPIDVLAAATLLLSAIFVLMHRNYKNVDQRLAD